MSKVKKECSEDQSSNHKFTAFQLKESGRRFTGKSKSFSDSTMLGEWVASNLSKDCVVEIRANAKGAANA